MKPYGTHASYLDGLEIGARRSIPFGLLVGVRKTAHSRGVKFSIVNRAGNSVLIERVEKTRWGTVKERMAQLAIGDALTAPATQRPSYLNAAHMLEIFVKIERAGDGMILITRTATPASPRQKIKSMLTGLCLGEAIKVSTEKRACSLCAASWRYRVRLSRAKISTGEYVLTRAA